MSEAVIDPAGEELEERIEFGESRGIQEAKYPWAIWMNPDNAGKQWKLVPGVHFTCALKAMEHAIRKQAKKKGMHIGVHRRKFDDKVCIIIDNKGSRA